MTFWLEVMLDLFCQFCRPCDTFNDSLGGFLLIQRPVKTVTTFKFTMDPARPPPTVFFLILMGACRAPHDAQQSPLTSCDTAKEKFMKDISIKESVAMADNYIKMGKQHKLSEFVIKESVEWILGGSELGRRPSPEMQGEQLVRAFELFEEYTQMSSRKLDWEPTIRQEVCELIRKIKDYILEYEVDKLMANQFVGRDD